MIFCGYTLILIIDKVLFDTHALFEDEHGHGGHDDHNDPAEIKLEVNMKASMAKNAALTGVTDPAVLK